MRSPISPSKKKMLSKSKLPHQSSQMLSTSKNSLQSKSSNLKKMKKKTKMTRFKLKPQTSWITCLIVGLTKKRRRLQKTLITRRSSNRPNNRVSHPSSTLCLCLPSPETVKMTTLPRLFLAHFLLKLTSQIKWQITLTVT